MLRETRSFSALLIVLLVFVTVASTAFGQDTTAADPAATPADAAAPATGVVPAADRTVDQLAAEQKRETQWRDMLHYIQMARADLAKSFAEAILADAKPDEIYRHSVEVSGSQVILTRALGVKKLQPIVQKIRQEIDKGYQLFRSDEKEIQRMIAKLSTGNLRARMRASTRLGQSEEYALPQLLAMLADPKTSAVLRQNISKVLPRGKRGNVRGLSEALIGAKDERVIQHVAAALGDIEYSHSVAHLKEVSLRKDITDATRKIVVAALVRCSDGDRSVLKKSLAELYYKTALKYYYRHDSVLPDERFTTANVWYFKSGVLTYTTVPREIFCDIYAMRMARKTLQADKTYSPAVSLWLGAYLRREAQLPQGAVDPLVAEGQAKAGDYTRAAGSDYAQQVLARSLRDGDTAVALGAIAALRDVAGAKNLPKIIDAGSVQPLVAAMSYPDRRVRFLAAEVLAHALPVESFPGYQVVMPVLSDALREGGSQRVLLVAEGKDLNVITDAMRGASYSVISSGNPLVAIKGAREAGGVDLVIISQSNLVDRTLSLIRSDPSMGPTPVIVLGAGSKLAALAKADGKMILVTPGKDAAPIIAALPQAAKLTAGTPLTPEEASDWSVRASKAIRLLGLTGNKVYNIAQTEPVLITVLADKRIAVTVAAANSLAILPGPKAQQAIASLADQADGAIEVRVPAYAALAESVRRFGNLLTKTQSQAIVDVVNSKIDVSVRKAAAGALGALNLPSDLASPLIMQSGGID
ncbi:MAG: hypothetical protein QGG42_16655 [Phycisphaerae bacterium]|jgi:hypothetical protein|nr:hypothetical protein [Phycisphaerae bacterium]